MKETHQLFLKFQSGEQVSNQEILHLVSYLESPDVNAQTVVDYDIQTAYFSCHIDGLDYETINGFTEVSETFLALQIFYDLKEDRVSEAVQPLLKVGNQFVRWLSILFLFSRVYELYYLNDCLEVAKEDPELLVRAAAVESMGRCLPRLNNDGALKQEIGSYLSSLISSSNSEVMDSAHQAIYLALYDDGETPISFEDNFQIEPRDFAKFQELYLS